MKTIVILILSFILFTSCESRHHTIVYDNGQVGYVTDNQRVRDINNTVVISAYTTQTKDGYRTITRVYGVFKDTLPEDTKFNKGNSRITITYRKAVFINN